MPLAKGKSQKGELIFFNDTIIINKGGVRDLTMES